MRLIARSNLEAFALEHPETRAALTQWRLRIKAASWRSLAEVVEDFSKAKTCGPDRVRFEIAGGNYRLIAAFDFEKQIAFVKFLGSHSDYDRVDAATVSLF